MQDDQTIVYVDQSGHRHTFDYSVDGIIIWIEYYANGHASKPAILQRGANQAIAILEAHGKIVRQPKQTAE